MLKTHVIDHHFSTRFNVVSSSGHMKQGVIGNCKSKHKKALCGMNETIITCHLECGEFVALFNS